MHTLLFYEPGHFHAALTLRVSNPRVDDTVHLYAVPGPERDAFLGLVGAFNHRDEAPTRWQVELHEGDDPGELLERVITERAGDSVVLAGKNDRKLATIAALTEAGLHVLADKPWALGTEALGDLARLGSGRALAMDIMTSRFDVVARLRRALTRDPDLFAGFRPGADPAIEIYSVHHLLKVVNRAPLRRPPWYYDVRVQGDGVVDIQSHMTDQAQWLLEGEDEPSYERDVAGLRAERWATAVPLDVYRRSTGLDTFDPAIASRVREGVLPLACNAEIAYELRGVAVRQRAEWRALEPADGGDQHHSVLRGNLSDVVVRQGPETGYEKRLHVRPRAGDLGPALDAAVGRWQHDLPGLGWRSGEHGLELVIPRALRSGHEAHFAMVLETFLDHLDAGAWPPHLGATIRTRYTLLAHAHAGCVDREAAP